MATETVKPELMEQGEVSRGYLTKLSKEQHLTCIDKPRGSSAVVPRQDQQPAENTQSFTGNRNIQSFVE